MSENEPGAEQRRRTTLATAAFATAAVVAISQLRWEPAWTQILASCAVLVVGAAVVAPNRSPGLLTHRRAIAIGGPLLLGTILLGLSVGLLVLLDRSWPGPTTATAAGVLLVLLVPLAEEAFFRGALLRALPSRPVESALLSSALFGVLHLPLGAGPAALMALAGLVLAAVALSTRSWALPAVAHACFNGLATAYREDQTLYAILPVVWVVGLALVGLLRPRKVS